MPIRSVPMALCHFGMPQSRADMVILGKKIPGSDVSEPGFSPMKHKTSECGSDAWIAQSIQLNQNKTVNVGEI